MTFEEWYEQEHGTHPDLIEDIYAIDYMSASRMGWYASQAQAVEIAALKERVAELEYEIQCAYEDMAGENI